MRLNNESLNWIYQQINELKRTLVTLDYIMQNCKWDSEARRRIDDHLDDLALSFLLVAMGENIPKTLWSVGDYSILYGLIDENRDIDGMELRDYE